MNNKITPGIFYLIDGILYVVIAGLKTNEYHFLNLSSCEVVTTIKCSIPLAFSSFQTSKTFPKGILVERGKAKVLHPISSSKIIEDAVYPKTALVAKDKDSDLKEYFLIIKLNTGTAVLSMNTWCICFDVITNAIGIDTKSLMEFLDRLGYYDVFLTRKNIHFMRHI